MIKLNKPFTSLNMASSTIEQSKFGAFRSSNFLFVKEGVCQGRNGSSYKIWIVITIVAQSIEGNYSIINCKLYLQATAFSNSAFNHNKINYCWINADGQVRAINQNIDTRNFALVLLKDENYTINHENNGSRNFYFEAGFFISSNTLSSGRVDGYVDLPVISRASHCTFNDLAVEDDLYINTNRSSSNFYHNIDVYIANTKILSRETVAQDIIIKFSDEEIKMIYGLMSTILSTELKVVCATYNNEQLLGTAETIRTCYINREKCKPQVITQGESAAKLIPKEGMPLYGTNIPRGLVRGYSHITASGFQFEAQNETALKEIRFKFGSLESVRNYSEGEILDIGLDTTMDEMSYTAILTVVDNRGLENSIIYNFYDSNYIPPKILKAEARRKNGVEAECYLDVEIQIQKEIKDQITETLIQNNVLFLGYYHETASIKEEINLTQYVKNGTYDAERQVLSVNDIPIRKTNEKAGFEVGNSYTIELICENGFGEDINFADSVVWNETSTLFTINSGKFLDSSYRDANGIYRSGYHCLPSNDYEHIFEGNVLFKNSVDFQNSAYMIARQVENITVNVGSTYYSALTVDKSKHIKYEGSRMIFEKAGVYQIRFFVHLAGQNANRRSFINLEFKNGGELCPLTTRSNDAQNLFGDACYELNATVCVKENTEMDMTIYAQNVETIQGSKVWNDSSTYISIFKVAEYPIST